MFISILYDDQGQIVAAAPTCDVQSEGSQYWSNHFAIPASNGTIGEVGVHEVDDKDLATALLSLELEPASLVDVQRRWNQYLHPGSGFGTPILRCHHKSNSKPGSKIVIPKAA